MRFLPRAVLGVALALLAGCSTSNQKPQELPAPPAILTFAADKTQISAGQSVILSFTSKDAQSAVLTDQLGNGITLSGDASGGSATVTPTQSTFYVLRVTGAGGGDTAFVQVAVNEELKDVFLVAAPTTVNSGQSTQLLWSAFKARDASIQSSSGDQIQLDITKGSGVLEVSPARSTSYTLTGTRFDGSITASTEVLVAPVLLSFEANPAAAKAGETLTLNWKTAGAAEVTVSEATFGELKKVSFPAEATQVDDGSFDWTVPTMLPDGTAVRDGLPLHFTLTVAQGHPVATLTKSIDTFVGDGPLITQFLVPQAVTTGQKVQLSWTTANVDRIQILANGLLVFEPPATQQDQVDQGSVSLPSISGTMTYELIAYGHEGTQATETHQTKLVNPPVIDTFTLPSSITNPGDAASAQWTTHDATAVNIRVKNGPVVFSSSTAVSTGTTNIYPGVRVTFVLEAWNDAGLKATSEKTVDVANPGTMTASVSPVTAGDPVTYNWSVGGPNVLDVVGDPTAAPAKNNAPQSFYDLGNDPAAQQLSMSNADESVSQLQLARPFRFPFLGPVMENFYVSTNGFVAFAPTAALSKNGDLASTTDSFPPMIAPFWDDLFLGADSRILYKVQGTDFPRSLIIQWDKVHSGTNTELTFQVQLMESGAVSLAYKTLNGTGSDGAQATVGWRANKNLGSTWSKDTAAALTAGLQLSFFDGGAATGQAVVKPEKAGAFTLFTTLSNQTHVVYPAQVNVIAPAAVVVNEVMAAPQASVLQGQWVELYNASQDTVDLTGTQLLSDQTSTSFDLPDGFQLPPGGYVVIGQSMDPTLNGGAPVQLEATGFTIKAGGDIVKLIATGTISSLQFTAPQVVAGASLMGGGPSVLAANGGPYVCSTKTHTFGTPSSLGTPGSINESCFPYTLQLIDSNFEDITLSGALVPDFSGFSGTQEFKLDLSSAPFTFFNAPVFAAFVTGRGEMSLAATQPSSLAPGTDNPVNTSDQVTYKNHGMVAPFWDGTYQSSHGNLIYAHLPANAHLPARWVIQWAHITKSALPNSQSINDDSDFNYEVKLFDDGSIEYHYGSMFYGLKQPVPLNGQAATIWLTAPDFSAFLPVGVNQPVQQDNVAFRYAPAPMGGGGIVTPSGGGGVPSGG